MPTVEEPVRFDLTSTAWQYMQARGSVDAERAPVKVPPAAGVATIAVGLAVLFGLTSLAPGVEDAGRLFVLPLALGLWILAGLGLLDLLVLRRWYMPRLFGFGRRTTHTVLLDGQGLRIKQRGADACVAWPACAWVHVGKRAIALHGLGFRVDIPVRDAATRTALGAAIEKARAQHTPMDASSAAPPSPAAEPASPVNEPPTPPRAVLSAWHRTWLLVEAANNAVWIGGITLATCAVWLGPLQPFVKAPSGALPWVVVVGVFIGILFVHVRWRRRVDSILAASLSEPETVWSCDEGGLQATAKHWRIMQEWDCFQRAELVDDTLLLWQGRIVSLTLRLDEITGGHEAAAKVPAWIAQTRGAKPNI